MQSFYVEEYSSMTLFIALNIIREQQDPSLQFDFCCRAGICGSCGMVINGRPGLACHTQTRDLPDHIVLHPLPVFKLLGDLSVDTGVWFREVGRKIEAWVHTQDKAFDPRAEEKRMENELAEQIFELDRCIECGFCEVNCLTCGLTLSSRQRIVVRREIARLALHQLVTDGRIHPARIEEVVAKVQKQIEEEIVEVGKRTTIDLGIHGLHPELIRMIGKMKYRSSYGQNLLQHARETANLAGIMASELGLNPKIARRAGLLHDIGKVPDDEPELPHAIIGMKLAEKFKEKPEVCNAIGAHHDEVEMTSLIAPIIQVCDAISGARPGARREVVESYIKRLKEMEDIALSYPGVMKTYAIQAGRELRVIVGADKLSDQESEGLSHDIAKKIQDEMTYPGQVKITVIRETRAVSYAK